ncbi:MAG: formylmethanofuran dehydrogenase subunit C [Candidatus Helarchaeota archaeon]
MAEITLTPKKDALSSAVPLEAEIITTNNFAGKSIDEIKKLPVWKGNREKTLGDFFDVKGSKADDPAQLKITIDGDVSMVKGIGKKMTAGEIVINGNAGMHTGDLLSGGKITVNGNVDDFCGLEMKKGELIINGNAGNYFIAADRGNWRGMTGGKVVVNGNVGSEMAAWVRGKATRIEINGNVKTFAGVHMHGGVLTINGDAEYRLGAEMARGIIILNGKTDTLLPSFKYAGEVQEIEISENEKVQGKYLQFNGDYGQIPVKSKYFGRIFLAADKNQHLIPK